MRRDASVGVDLYGRDVSASKALKTVGQSAENLGRKINDVTNRIIKGMTLAAGAAAAAAVKIGVDSVKSASDFNETLSKTQVIFGKNADEVIRFAEASATMLGQSKTQTLDALGTFALFAKVAGKTGKDAVKFSESLTTLSADLASFYNTSPEDAIVALGAALRGENEPIRRYNVLINDMAMKQLLLSKHLYKGKGTLTAQQKALAAYMLIMQQTKVAQGDFARTAGGLANQQRILAAEIENAKIKLGTLLLPIVTKYIHVLTEELLPKIEEWIIANGPQLQKTFEEMVPKFEAFIGKLLDLGKWFADNKESVVTFGKSLLAALAAEKVAASVYAIITVLAKLRKEFLLLAGAEALATGGVNIAAGLAAIAAAGIAYTVADSAMGGPVTAASRASRTKSQTLMGTSMGEVTGQFGYGAYAAARSAPIIVNVHGSIMTENQTLRMVKEGLSRIATRNGYGHGGRD